jgi:hypothetical protein
MEWYGYMRVKKKYLITAVIFVIATFFNWMKIPIQDTYVEIVKTCLYCVLGGFAFKTWLGKR